MATKTIPPETLNGLLVASDTHTAVYGSKQRRIAVVVKVSKEGLVHYLVYENCTVDLRVAGRDKFLADYPVEYYHYPALRAIRKMAQWVRGGWACTDTARKVINAILAR